MEVELAYLLATRVCSRSSRGTRRKNRRSRRVIWDEFVENVYLVYIVSKLSLQRIYGFVITNCESVCKAPSCVVAESLGFNSDICVYHVLCIVYVEFNFWVCK